MLSPILRFVPPDVYASGTVAWFPSPSVNSKLYWSDPDVFILTVSVSTPANPAYFISHRPKNACGSSIYSVKLCPAATK